LLGQVAAGTDPAAQRVEVRQRVEVLGVILTRYLGSKQAALKPRAYAEVARHLLNHGKPLHRLELDAIDRRAIAERLAEIEASSGPVARNRVRASLSGFFAWAIAEGLVEANPVMGTARADEGGSRDRVLSNDELRSIWRALPQDQFGDIVRLLILTGQRREEIGGLRWSEVDLERGLIVLPPARTKNSRQHEVPLSPMAVEILARQPRRKGRDLIFGLGAGGFSGWSDCKGALDERLGDKMQPWRLHDLRRTVATGMADRLGVLPHVVEAVLNHVSGHRAGVAGVYNRARYEAEMRQALERWAEHVATIAG
jgi:integrase